MVKKEWQMTTDHFQLVVVWHEVEAKDIDKLNSGEPIPAGDRYVMIGPPGGQLARIDATDAEMVLPQLYAFFGPGMGLGLSPMGIPPPRGAYMPGRPGRPIPPAF